MSTFTEGINAASRAIGAINETLKLLVDEIDDLNKMIEAQKNSARVASERITGNSKRIGVMEYKLREKGLL